MNANRVVQRQGSGGLAICRAWIARLAGLAVLMTATVAIPQTPNSIEQVSVTRGAAGYTVVRFTMKAPPANPPAGFAITSPPRIALDFMDTASALPSNQRAVDDPALRSLQFVQAGNRTRVVFNLNKPQSFDTKIEGNAVVVTLADSGGSSPTSGPAAPAPVQRFAEARGSDQQHSLRDVDFRRGKNGEGRIVVDLSDSNAGIDIRQQGRQLIVDFQKTSVPRNLERRMDVADFNTPVVTIDTSEVNGNARMVIEPKGIWEHSAYQADNRFIIEVKPVQDDPNKLVQGSRAGYKGEKLSLNFQNIEVRSVLQVIADFTGLNIVTSDTVQGSLTLRLKDVPWDQALDIILQTKGLDMRKNGNIVLIAPREELALKEKQQLESQAQINDLEPLQTEMFQLNYAKAADLLNIVNVQTGGAGGQGGSGARFLSKHGVRRSAHQHSVRDRHRVAARGSTPRDPADRHVGAAGADRSAHRHRGRYVQPRARHPLRPADGGDAAQPSLRVRQRRIAVDDAGGVDRQRRKRHRHPRNAHADAVRARIGHRVGRLLGFAAAQRQPPRAEPGGPARVDADQSRQRQHHQPRVVRARSRQSRQGRLEPASRHRGQSEGADRAGPGRPGGHPGFRRGLERDASHGDVPQGGAEPAGHAADHRGQPDHDGR
jgi:hypothetical protein